MGTGRGLGVLKAEFDASLDVAALEAKRWLASIEQRPVCPEADGMAMLRAFDEELPFKGEPAEFVVKLLAERRRARAHGNELRAILRVGHRRSAAGGARGRLARQRLGPERRDRRAGAGGVRHRAGDLALGPRAARPAADVLGRVRHRGADGQHGLLGSSSQPRARRPRLGRRIRRAPRCAARHRCRGRGAAQCHRPGSRSSGSDRGLCKDRRGRRGRTDPAGDARGGPGGRERADDRLRQAGNVNGGAVDRLGPVRDVVDRRGAEGIWLHVDGAFGLWGRADPSRRHLLEDVDRRRLLGDRRPQVAEHPL